MKITLNSSIPEERREQIEKLVKLRAGATDIVWSSSRFPRYVMLVEPGAEAEEEPAGGSLFESPVSGDRALASVTAHLEAQIESCLAQPLPGAPEGRGK